MPYSQEVKHGNLEPKPEVSGGGKLSIFYYDYEKRYPPKLVRIQTNWDFYLSNFSWILTFSNS